MKKSFLFILLSLFLWTGCEELPPTVNPLMGPPEEPPIVVDDQLRNVLIEEFTGVTCVQCPGGSAEIEALLGIHGSRLVAVSIHAGDFSFPFPDSQVDFRSDEGNQLINYLGSPYGYPSAVINRKKFDGEFDLQLGKDQWAGYIELEKAETPKVRIGVRTDYNESTGGITVDAKLFVDETVDNPNARISVMITESGIVDKQDSTNGIIEDYEHKHVLRGMLTSFQGDAIPFDLVAGAEGEITFTGTLGADWVPDKCKVIVLVHINDADKDVLQAVEVDLVE